MTTPTGLPIGATAIADRATGNELKPNPDGSINIDVQNGAWTVVYSTTQTGVTAWAGSGDITGMHAYSTLAVTINVSAFSGTSIAFSVKRKDSLGNYVTTGSGTSITAVGSQTIDIGPGMSKNNAFLDIIQITAVITSATVTFTVDVQAR